MRSQRLALHRSLILLINIQGNTVATGQHTSNGEQWLLPLTSTPQGNYLALLNNGMIEAEARTQ